MYRRLITLAAATLAVAACQKAETPEMMQSRLNSESAAAKTEVSATAHEFGVHLSANHMDSLSAYFTDDAVIMPPNSPAITGKAAIDTWFKANPMAPGTQIALTTVEVVANGPLAVERGTYAFSMAASTGRPAVNVAGKYLNHLHMVNGKWKIAAQMWSDDVPAMAMAPAPPPRH